MSSDTRSEMDKEQQPVDAPADAGSVDGEIDPALVDVDPVEAQDQLDQALSDVQENRDQCLRLQADLENLRKRNQRDVANAHKFGLEKFAVELLGVKDSLEMGITAASEETADMQKLKEGSELTLKMLSDAFKKFNVSEINPLKNKFNPEYHEAMSMQERSDVDPNTVIAVMQKGYLLNDRLIRPAMVIVSKQASTEKGAQLDEQA
ncbi:MAG: nucleotide exchange factor GrpE [Gammaproteobacteria bacterium]